MAKETNSDEFDNTTSDHVSKDTSDLLIAVVGRTLAGAGVAREVGVGAVLGTAAATCRLARVLAAERVPALEGAEGHGLLKVATLILATLAEGTLDDLVVVEEVEGALDELPGLDTDDVEEREADDDAPLPRDANVLEKGGVERRDVDDGEDGKGADDDGPEEELVVIDVLEEGELALAVGVQAEHGSAQVLELPGRDEDDPGKLGEDSSTGAEHGSAGLGESLVALLAKGSAVGTVDDNDERGQRQCTHDDAVDNHVDDDLVGKDTALLVLGGLAHDISGGLLATKTEGREGRSNHVDPENLKGRDGEDGEVGAVAESETAAKEDDLANVGAEQMENELLDVVEHATTLADGGDDGVELVIGQDDLGSGLCDVGSGTHGDTNVSAGQRGGVVDTITGHCHKGVAATKCINHASLRIGGASGNDQRELRHGVNLLVRHFVEIGSLLDNGFGESVRQDTEVLGDNADLLGDGLGSLGVVASKHVHLDAGRGTFGDGWLGLAAGRVVDSGQAEKSKALFNLSSEGILLLLGNVGLLSGESAVPVAVTDSKHTLALRRQVVHLVENLLLELLGKLDLVIAETNVAAQVQDSLDGALGEDEAVSRAPDVGRLAGLGKVVDDGHALDGTVKRELGQLLPAEALEGLLAELETVGKDLKGDLGRLASGLPLCFFLVISNGSQVAESGGQQESLEAGRHLGLVLGLRLLGGLLVLQLLLGDVELKDGSGTLLVVVALGRLLNLVFLLLGFGVGDSTLRRVVGAFLVGANVGDTAESLEGGKVSDDDVGLSHDGHGDNHGDDDDLASDIELVSGEDDNGQDDGTAEEDVCQSGKLPLQRGTLGETQELADGIVDALGETNNGLALAVLLVVHGAAGLADLLLGGGGDLSDLGLHSSSDDDATATALADDGGGIGDVETVTDTDLALLGGQLIGTRDCNVGLGDLIDGLSLTGQGLFVAGQVHGLENAHVGRHGIAHLEQDDVTGHNLGTVTRVSCLPSRIKQEGQRKAKRAKT
ncbi:hypothetical protein ColKHC_01867 [Colletotrichum higginsianum]|nr:hypothetical protein ColKHC_01867 [Colletotrichum higginsianum]